MSLAANASAPVSAPSPELVRWRRKVFVATWLSYVGFYFCRKPFSAAKSAIGAEAGFNATTLGDIGAAYLIAYAIGQFLAGWSGTRFGPRANVLAGMGLSIVVTLAMGVHLDAWVLAGLVAVNGLAQATGWSGNVGTMASWYGKHERGRVMGAWATNFTVGSLLSATVMAWLLGRHAEGAPAPWRDCLYVGAGVLGVIWAVFYAWQRNRPEDVGLPPIEADVQDAGGGGGTPSRSPSDGDLRGRGQSLAEPGSASPSGERSLPTLAARGPSGANRGGVLRNASPDASGTPSEPSGFGGLSRAAWTNLLLVAGFYFFAKLVRYAVWSWVPFFLERNYGLTGSAANVYATAFDLMGIPGVWVAGWLSDRYFQSRRGEVALLLMLGMTLACGLLLVLGHLGVGVFAVLLALVGFTLYGPDALLTGAGAMDIGNARSATFAAAMISGVGSLGPIVQELVIGRMYDAKGGDLAPVFALLFGSAVAAACFGGGLVWRNRRGGVGV